MIGVDEEGVIQWKWLRIINEKYVAWSCSELSLYSLQTNRERTENEQWEINFLGKPAEPLY